MKDFSIRQIIQACNGQYNGDPALLDQCVTNIVTDSRAITPGCLYIPIIGERFDGHHFIQSALDNGAICSLTENAIESAQNLIRVESTFQALKDIAAAYRMLFDIPVIAVTGSVGKTTTKSFIASVLSQKFNVHQSEKNFNNEIGVPLTLFKLEEQHQYAVVEMGMNNLGEISRLSKTAVPDICVITNIGYAHAGRLNGRDGIYQAKTEIFDYAKIPCTAYLNGDDDRLIDYRNEHATIHYFGLNKANEITATDIVPLGYQGTQCTLEIDDHSIPIHIRQPGQHLVYAALTAAAIGYTAGLSPSQIQQGIADLAPVSGRMNIMELDHITILDDVYNAGLASIKAAIDVLNYAPGRRVCILGDILELNEFAPTIHHQVGQYAGEQQVDLLLCAGEEAQHIASGASEYDIPIHYYPMQDQLIDALPQHIQAGDTILVKASRGMKFENIVKALEKLQF